MSIETKNAIIESASISIDENGFLACPLMLDYGKTTQQCFGTLVLYLPKSFSHHSTMTPAGHLIYRVMEIAGVTKWDDLPGKTIRVKTEHTGIHAIGHIVKEDWFNPSEDFKKEAE